MPFNYELTRRIVSSSLLEENALEDGNFIAPTTDTMCFKVPLTTTVTDSILQTLMLTQLPLPKVAHWRYILLRRPRRLEEAYLTYQ